MVTKLNIFFFAHIKLFLTMCPVTLFEFLMLNTFTDQIEIIDIKYTLFITFHILCGEKDEVKRCFLKYSLQKVQLHPSPNTTQKNFENKIDFLRDFIFNASIYKRNIYTCKLVSVFEHFTIQGCTYKVLMEKLKSVQK